ncbi:MAG: hypothetical protein JWL60_530 [Gemmatimonadetes bacterium]|nr:hypothetical protein [Gemmatimonadota bacterium]
MDREYLVLFAAIAVTGALVAAVAGRRALFAALPLLVTLNGITMTTPIGMVRFDQLAGLLIGLGFALAWMLDPQPLPIDRAMRWMLALLLLALWSSLFASPDRRYSVAQTANYFSAIWIYVVVLLSTDTVDDVDRVLDAFVIAGIVGGVVGILAFGLGMAGLPVGGANVDLSLRGTAFGAFGTMREPNIFGSFCQIFFVFGVALVQLPSTAARVLPSGRLVLLLVVSSLGLVLSFTRGAWIGALVGLIGITVLNAVVFGARVRYGRVLIPVVIALVAGVVTWNVSPDAQEFMEEKLVNLVNPQSENAAIRLLMYGRALENIRQHPWFGWGTYSFAPMSVSGIDVRLLGNQHDVWIGNYILLTLHDTGVAGLLVFGGILLSVLRPAVRVAKAWVRADPVHAVRLSGLVAAFGSLLVSFLTSSGFTFGYPWLLLGIIGAYLRVGRAAREAEGETEPTA